MPITLDTVEAQVGLDILNDLSTKFPVVDTQTSTFRGQLQDAIDSEEPPPEARKGGGRKAADDKG